MGNLKEKIIEQREREEQARKERFEEMKSVFACISGSSEGEKVLKELYRRSGYGKPNRAINETFGSLDVNGMIFNEGRRSLWQEIRAFIPKKYLARIEE